MVFALDKYVDVLVSLGINPTQLFFCQIIYERGHDLLYKIAQEGFSFPREYLDQLELIGLIVNTNPSGDNTFADYYEVTDKFVSEFYTATKQDGEEFWKKYPAYLNISGKSIPAKGVNKEEMIRWYHQNIGTVHNHNEVMTALEYAVNKKLINQRIDKWLESEAFVDIWEMMKDDTSESLPHERII